MVCHLLWLQLYNVNKLKLPMYSFLWFGTGNNSTMYTYIFHLPLADDEYSDWLRTVYLFTLSTQYSVIWENKYIYIQYFD